MRVGPAGSTVNYREAEEECALIYAEAPGRINREKGGAGSVSEDSTAKTTVVADGEMVLGPFD